MFNEALKSGNLPEEVYEGNIIDLYKGKGVKIDPNNYRGIALLDTTLKIYTAILCSRLNEAVESHKLLPDTQYGFRKGRSTIKAAKVLKGYINHDILEAGHSYACFVDFKQAFDSVSRNKLAHKLYRMKIRGPFLRSIIAILRGTRVAVRQDRTNSEFFTTTKGIPQGDRLSPILFALFIADLSEILLKQGVKVIFYADDLVITSSKIENIQDALDRLAMYCEDNELRVNVAKTHAMKFRKGGRIHPRDKLYYNKQPISYQNSFIYLGIVFSTKQSLDSHLHHLKSKSAKALNRLHAKVNLRKVRYKSAGRLLDSIIKQTATYGTEVFNLLDDEKSNNKFVEHCKKICGMFWKRWCGISLYWRNSRLLKMMHIDDPLRIQRCRKVDRRKIAIYYANGYHHKMCSENNCYDIKDDCQCKFCKFPIFGPDHIFLCSNIQESKYLDKVRFLYGHDSSDAQ